MNNALHNQECPPLMADGRHGTDYRPSCDTHQLIQRQNSIVSAHDFRYFLQNNADKLMEINSTYFQNSKSCPPCNYHNPDPFGHDKYWEFYRERLGFGQPGQSKTQNMTWTGHH